MAAGPADPSVRSVLITTDAVGGVWTYSVDLARGLADRGVQVRVAVLGPAPSADQARELAGVAELVSTGLPLDWLAETAEQVERAGADLAAICRSAAPDMVHLNSPALAAGADFGAPVLGACHSCLATWWASVKSAAPPLELAWRTEAHRAGLARCDALIAPSHAFADQTERAYGLRPLVVHNGRGRPLSGHVGDAASHFVFTAGRLWDEGKNVGTLSQAAAHLDLPVLAAGALSGPQGQIAPATGLTPLGVLTAHELATIFERRPTFVSVALYEPFGLAVLEAAQAACPLVLSDIPTFRELWDGAAMFVPPHDASGLAAELTALARDPRRRDDLGRRAHDRSAGYSAAAMAEETLEIYRRLLDGRAFTGLAA